MNPHAAPPYTNMQLSTVIHALKLVMRISAQPSGLSLQKEACTPEIAAHTSVGARPFQPSRPGPLKYRAASGPYTTRDSRSVPSAHMPSALIVCW